MTEDPKFRIVCPACGVAHTTGLAALRGEDENMTATIREIVEVEARINEEIARNRKTLRRVMYCWLVVGASALSAAGAYYGGADLVSKWSAIAANLTTTLLAFIAAAYVTDLKIWSLRP